MNVSTYGHDQGIKQHLFQRDAIFFAGSHDLRPGPQAILHGFGNTAFVHGEGHQRGFIFGRQGDNPCQTGFLGIGGINHARGVVDGCQPCLQHLRVGAVQTQRGVHLGLNSCHRPFHGLHFICLGTHAGSHVDIDKTSAGGNLLLGQSEESGSVTIEDDRFNGSQSAVDLFPNNNHTEPFSGLNWSSLRLG